jgi:hypothetical protein
VHPLTMSLGYFVVAEARCKWYLYDINIFPLKKKMSCSISFKAILVKQSLFGQFYFIEKSTTIYINANATSMDPSCIIYVLSAYLFCPVDVDTCFLLKRERRLPRKKRERCRS